MTAAQERLLSTCRANRVVVLRYLGKTRGVFVDGRRAHIQGVTVERLLSDGHCRLIRDPDGATDYHFVLVPRNRWTDPA